MAILPTYTPNPSRSAIGYFFKTLQDYYDKTGDDQALTFMTPISCVIATSEEDAIAQVDAAKAAIQFYNDYYLVFPKASDRAVWIKIKDEVADHSA